MSEAEPDKEIQPMVTEIAPEAYKRLCKVVKAGTFRSVSFNPWHKGCDTELDASCKWADLKDELETWYYEYQGEFEMHTCATVLPSFADKKLIFAVSTQWDREMDQMSDLGEGWDQESFQDFVYNLLSPKIKKHTSPEELWISLDLEYEGPDQLTILSISISESCDKGKDFSTSLTPENEKLIAEYVLDWCETNHGESDNFSISVDFNEISGVKSSSPCEHFLVIPKKPEQTGS